MFLGKSKQNRPHFFWANCLLFGFFIFGIFYSLLQPNVAFAACSINVSWRNADGSFVPGQGNSSKGTTIQATGGNDYIAQADFSGCKGDLLTLVVFKNDSTIVGSNSPSTAPSDSTDNDHLTQTISIAEGDSNKYSIQADAYTFNNTTLQRSLVSEAISAYLSAASASGTPPPPPPLTGGDPNTNCQTQAYWQGANGGSKFSQTTLPPGTYQATAGFANCTGNVYIIVCPNPDGSAGCSNALAQTTVSGNAKLISTQVAVKDGTKYYFDVKMDPGKILATSPQITGQEGVPNPITAQTGNNNANNNTNAGSPGAPSSGQPVDLNALAASVDHHVNPINATSFIDFAFRLIQVFLGIIGAFAVLFIIIGGFQVATSNGNPEAVTKGKLTITWAVVGLLVALLSFSLVAIVQNLFK